MVIQNFKMSACIPFREVVYSRLFCTTVVCPELVIFVALHCVQSRCDFFFIRTTVYPELVICIELQCILSW